MATVLFTTRGETRNYPTTIAGFARDISNGTATIKDYAHNMELGSVGLYLPNGKTFWIIFTDNSNDPNWRTGFYQITTGDYDRADLHAMLEDRSRLNYAANWHTNGNSHGLIQAYVQAYVNELSENDGYWPDYSTVEYN